MQNPYNRYQKNQNTEVSSKPKNKKKTASSPARKPKRRPQKNSNKPKGTHWAWVMLSFLGLSLSFYIFMYTDQFIDTISRVQVNFNSVMASEGENSSDQGEKKDQKDKSLPVGRVSQLKSDADHLTMKNASVYKALKEKEEELDKKERRLAQLEEELQIQKDEIEKQLKEMKEMRRNISSKLDQKVSADKESVEKLVGVYSNMKPQNAATIISQVEDDLAVKVLGQMNKRNAAAILNYIEPKKARMLSEKFTGLKK